MHPSLRFSLRRGMVCLALLGFATIGVIASEWTDYFPEDQEIQLSATTCELDTQGAPVNQVCVALTRGAVTNGECSIQVTVSSSQQDLTSIEVQTGDDDNQNGTIDSGEWDSVGAATAQSDGSGGSLATVSGTILVQHDAFRVVHVWDWGTSSDSLHIAAVD